MAADPISYIFGGTSGTPTYEELLRRRAIATAQAGRQRKLPTTLGEGMTYLGEAVGENLKERQLAERESAYGERAASDPLRIAPVDGGAGATRPTAAAPVAAPPVLDAGTPLPDYTGRDRIAAAYAGSPQEVASLDPTQGAATPLGSPSAEEARWIARIGGGSGIDDGAVASQYRTAIGGIESSNDYSAVGVPTKYGRAHGRYGVIEANIPKWTQQVLGRAMTPQEFLKNEKAQDAVFDAKFGEYVAKYGPEKAARAWYGGEGNINNLNATDTHEKLSVHDYGRDFLKRLRGKRAEAGGPEPAPVQLASLGGPTSVGGSPEPDATVVADIQPRPMQIAQAGGMPTMRAGASAGPPVLPDPAPITPQEIRADAIRRAYPGDPRAEAQAKMLEEYGKGHRAQINARNAELYRGEVTAYEQTKRTLEQRVYDEPKRAQEMQKTAGEIAAQKVAQEKAAREVREGEQFPFGKAKVLDMSEKSYETVKGIPASQVAIANVRQILPQMFSGQMADANLGWSKFKSAIGLPQDPRIGPTESFSSFVVPILAQLRPAVIGTGAQTAPELALLEKAAAGKITLEASSIDQILNAIEKLNAVAAVQHHKRLKTNSGGDEKVREALFGNFELPMEQLVPRTQVELLRTEIAKNPERADLEMEEFDKDYHTPGLARRLLGK